ncbi:hypothetical protein OsI_22602 [Oryza sativa Indica Group]|uniref:UspA domain-containing protein n=1 Tax=Oryza sativa subsp. indica TaxID=39946 RepID=A2YBX3_ORYSI|nr:hypothetical protein OsI_22602 [Oryza sativa Indica Group]
MAEESREEGGDGGVVEDGDEAGGRPGKDGGSGGAGRGRDGNNGISTWEIEEMEDEAGPASLAPPAAADVYVAVGKGGSSMEALSWALRRLASPRSFVYLVHVFPVVISIPTGFGKITIGSQQSLVGDWPAALLKSRSSSWTSLGGDLSLTEFFKAGIVTSCSSILALLASCRPTLGIFCPIANLAAKKL